MGTMSDHGLTPGSTPSDHGIDNSAEAVSVTTSGFAGNLTVAEDTVQKALDKIDEFVLGGVGHTQGTDQGLDTGGANATTAAQVKTAVTNSHVSGSDNQDLSGLVVKEAGKSLVADTEIAKIHTAGSDDQDLSGKVDKIVGSSLLADTEAAKIHVAGSDDQDLSGKVDKEASKSLVADTEISKIHAVGDSIAASISDGDLTHSPNGNSVFDALAGKAATSQLQAAFGITIDGGGAVITTGVKGYIISPYACTITGWYLVGSPSGSIVIDVWKSAGAIPTVANRIAGTEIPTLAAQALNNDTNLTTWSTLTIAVGDVIGFNVDSVATCQIATLSIGILH